MAAACSLAGFWMLRRPRPALRNSLAVLALLALLPGLVSIAVATPPVVSDATLKKVENAMANADFQLSGPIVVEVVETGDTLRLILNKNVPLRRKLSL